MSNVFNLGAELEKVVKQDQAAMQSKGASEQARAGYRDRPEIPKGNEPNAPAEGQERVDTTREKTQLKFTTLESIFSEKIEEKPIVKGFFNEDEQTVFYAPGGVGKSLITQDISMTLGSNSIERLMGVI